MTRNYTAQKKYYNGIKMVTAKSSVHLPSRTNQIGLGLAKLNLYFEELNLGFLVGNDGIMYVTGIVLSNDGNVYLDWRNMKSCSTNLLNTPIIKISTARPSTSTNVTFRREKSNISDIWIIL